MTSQSNERNRMMVKFGPAWVNPESVAAVVPATPSPKTPGINGCSIWLNSGQTINVDGTTPDDAVLILGANP